MEPHAEKDTENRFQDANFLDFPFTCNEIKQGIIRLKKGNCAGPGLLLNEFIKCSASTMILTLVKLFNKVLLSGKFPDCWNHSLITPLYKSGDPTDCNNYRGISLTSCLGQTGGQPRAFRQGEVLRHFQNFREKFWSKFWISLYVLYI